MPKKKGSSRKETIKKAEHPTTSGCTGTRDELVVDEGSGDDEGSIHSEGNRSVIVLDEEVVEDTVQSPDGELQSRTVDRLLDFIEGTTQKSSSGRQTCLRGIVDIFLTCSDVNDVIEDRRLTLIDCVERSLKKGSSEERFLAVHLGEVLCFSWGPDSEELGLMMKPILIPIVSDVSERQELRGRAARCLALLNFVLSSDIINITETMAELKNIYRLSFLKGDGSVPSLPPSVSALHNVSLMSWSLLATLTPLSRVEELIEDNLAKLPQLLLSDDVNLRISAGECLALLYELGRESGRRTFRGQTHRELLERLEELATDSNRHRAKRDRRQQRSCFRDILRSISGMEYPYTKIRFGRELLELNSWCRKLQYNVFKDILGSGLSLYLRENHLLRDIFGLGAPLTVDHVVAKVSKRERQFINSENFKAQTTVRGKLRDKRSYRIPDE